MKIICAAKWPSCMFVSHTREKVRKKKGQTKSSVVWTEHAGGCKMQETTFNGKTWPCLANVTSLQLNVYPSTFFFHHLKIEKKKKLSPKVGLQLISICRVLIDKNVYMYWLTHNRETTWWIFVVHVLFELLITLYDWKACCYSPIDFFL